jgi:AcrR family transcriptional regulator
MKQQSKQRIFEVSIQEFAEHGLGGARMERIARRAGINKAMIFYYYTSKENLYRTIIRSSLTELFPQVNKAILTSPSPGEFFEILPDIYIRFFSRKQNIIRMIGIELIQRPENLKPIIKEIFSGIGWSPADNIRKRIVSWHEEGLITESDPVHFIMNVIPLCIFSLLAKPMVEAIFQIEIKDTETFLEARIQSISDLLKKGMLL